MCEAMTTPATLPADCPLRRPWRRHTMSYQPRRHHRRSIRLAGYDYGSPGAYFFTLCTFEHECVLGQVVNGEMRLSRLGSIVQRCWYSLPRHFPGIALDAFVVMPSHVHGIITIMGADRRGEALGESYARDGLTVPSPNASPLPVPPPDRPSGTQPGSLSAILQSLKSVATRKCNQVRGTPSAALWQRNYYEHIIRNEQELQRTRRYIVENPLHWEQDEDNPHAWPVP